ncbi:adenine phosphoribosyltransferase [Cellulomonas flavigena DSM 20109]|uniref:Adenine phosphoribosyltransferase n=1 Tax=Cellulomonas flavigena (strain ATCC 482 / DSM 20109 / BCRC 11376 / JCM 18109 / NBRC 3775 / NCIMB 8073 / NRS 134) TaxID=446466 RepID=D5UEN7_CELFN|nr:adenine phosphoribosyltransferase [Cellulomonas flavigena]ADG74697.1 adenine phosphoribosyltransferase [Cellulomonas flavigena DSM 20109]
MNGLVDGPGVTPGPSSDRDELAALVDGLLRTVPDFPEPGVQFRDIMPLLADADAFARVVAAFADHAHGPVDLVAGMEARGFLLASPVATALGAGVVPVRKAGKLPGPVVSQSYALEYGSAAVEVQPFTIPDGARVLVIDDVLATGGTAAATVELLESCGATVVGLSFLVELQALGGRALLPGRHVDTLLTLP